MTSAEKILAGIISEAEQSAEEIIQQAQRDADDIRAKAQLDAKQAADEIEKSADKKIAVINSTGDSAAAIVKRDAALKIKHELIESVLNDAMTRLQGLNDKEYFDFLYALASDCKISSGEMYLSETDLARELSGLEKNIKGLGFTLSRTPCDIKNGFIIRSGDIEINASFVSLFREKYGSLVDAVNKILFTN